MRVSLFKDFLRYGQSTFRITSKWTVGGQIYFHVKRYCNLSKNLTLNYFFPFTLADSNEDEEMEEEEELLAQNEVKDPRAGNVSVSLPQLKADFNQLADHLYKVGKLIKSLHFQNSNLHDIRSTQVGKNCWRYIKQSLKVSKFQNKFMMSSFFPKKETKSLQYFIRFLGKAMTSKICFEIYWPLAWHSGESTSKQ